MYRAKWRTCLGITGFPAFVRPVTFAAWYLGYYYIIKTQVKTTERLDKGIGPLEYTFK